MSQKAFLLLPILGMALLTIGVGLLMLKRRYKAVSEEGINPAYFQLNKGAKLPNDLIQVTQHYENLFETPILFYCAILLVVIINRVDNGYVILSWLYLLSRLAHAYIHITHNILRHRKNAFIASTVVLFILWIKLGIGITQV